MHITVWTNGTLTLSRFVASRWLVGGTIAHGVHGDDAATMRLVIPRATAYALFGDLTTPWLTVDSQGWPIYVGRIEQIEIGAQETTLTAYGPWRALSDSPYTALWSHSGTADWRPVLETEQAGWSPQRYTFDNNNRIFISPNKGDVHGGPVGARNIGGMAYRLPHLGRRAATTISFNYTTVLPSADWYLQIGWYSAAPGNAAWTNINAVNVIAGSGSGSITQTLTGSPVAVEIRVAPLFNPGVALVQESGTQYARCTNVRVTSQATPILASNIAADIVNAIATLNSAQLSSSTARIATTAIDRYEEVYEDEDPRQILERLALAEGNWEVGVDRERRLYLRAPGTSARTWVVERADLRLTRMLDDVTNSAYALYQESDNYVLRTATSTNAASQTRYGITRLRAISASQTTSSAQATSMRDASLTDTATPPPRAAITIPRGGLATESGGRVPGYLVQSGDTLRIRQVPADVAQVLDQLSAFRVGRRTYDLVTGVTTIEPLNPPDTLEVLLSQQR